VEYKAPDGVSKRRSTIMAKFTFDWNKVKDGIVESDKKKGFQKDARFWRPTVDKDGNATAVIRFLPDREGNPFIKYHQHNFKYMIDGNKKFYIKNCINDFGFDRECPVCKKNSEYWASSFEEDKKIASARKRKLIYVSNILVVKNPDCPEDEGKVFLYSYGEKIYGKAKEKMFPSDKVKELGEYDEYIPYDLYEGANFTLQQEKQGEFPNYDKSTFGKQCAVGSDKVIEKIMDQVYDLNEFTTEDKYPTNEEVVKLLGALLGIAESSTSTTAEPKKPDTSTQEPLEDVSSTGLVDDDLPFITDDTVGAEATEPSSDEEDDEFFKNLQ
jgi:hypothetical protein